MKAKGFALIELAALLAVVAVLAVFLTPLVSGYVDQVRQMRAADDLRAIAQAFKLHKRDTGQYPIYANDDEADGDIASVTELVGDGQTLGPAHGWEFSSNGDLDGFLNTNKLGLSAAAPGGGVAYRGPYLDRITADPWGNAYAVNAVNLLRGSSNLGFVISAGPDGVLNTERDQTGQLVPGGDDLVARIK